MIDAVIVIGVAASAREIGQVFKRFQGSWEVATDVENVRAASLLACDDYTLRASEPSILAGALVSGEGQRGHSVRPDQNKLILILAAS